MEKLRQLVRKQQQEMADHEREAQARFTLELERTQQQLRDAQTELLNERRERIQEKQRELDERLQRSLASAEEQREDAQVVRPASQVDVSSFFNTSVELPERIRDIMGEWKQRMEDAIAGTVRSMSMEPAATARAPVVRSRDDDARRAVVNSASEGAIESADEGLPRRAPSAALSGDEPSTLRGSQSATTFRRRVKSHRQVRRSLFDQDIRCDEHSLVESESDSDSESVERVSSSEDDENTTSEDERRHRQRDRQRQKSQRHELRRQVPTSQRQRRRRTGAMVHGSHKTVAEQHARCRSDGYSNHEPVDRTRQTRDHSDSDDANGDGDDDAAVLANSASSHSFVLIDRLPGGCRSGSCSSFSGMFESSLFEVVDALEHVSPSRPVALSTSGHNGMHHVDSHESETDAGRESSSAERLERLLRGMQARERRLAHLDDEASRSAASVALEAPGSATVDSDFELFNQVKDVYESEFLHQQQQQQRLNRPGCTGWVDSELSVRAVVENDMAELLRQQEAGSHH